MKLLLLFSLIHLTLCKLLFHDHHQESPSWHIYHYHSSSDYSFTGPLLQLKIDDHSCSLKFDQIDNFLASPDFYKNLTSSIGFLHWADARFSGCYEFSDITSHLDRLNQTWVERGFPPLAALVFSSSIDSDQSFGGVHSDPTGSIHINQSQSFPLNIVGLDTGIHLSKTLLTSASPFVVTLTSDSGPWNDFLHSHVRIVQYWFFLVLYSLVCLMAVFQLIKTIFQKKPEISFKLTVLIACVYFTLVHVFIPLELATSGVTLSLNIISWFLGFTLFNIIVIRWAKLVYNLTNEKSCLYFIYFCYLVITDFAFISLVLIVACLARIRWLYDLGWKLETSLHPILLISQAILMLLHYYLIRKRICHLSLSKQYLQSLHKLTYLIYVTVFGWIALSFCCIAETTHWTYTPFGFLLVVFSYKIATVLLFTTMTLMVSVPKPVDNEFLIISNKSPQSSPPKYPDQEQFYLISPPPSTRKSHRKNSPIKHVTRQLYQLKEVPEEHDESVTL